MLDCATCHRQVPDHSRNCPYCQADAGFPNVRAASKANEVEALNERFKNALVSARARKCEHVLLDFGNSVRKSQAVISRNLSAIQALLSSDTILYQNFYKQVHAGLRLPEDNPWDRGRNAVDGTLFPHYQTEIVFGALALDDKGPQSYGAFTMVLKEAMIEQRATVFEENSFHFCQIKHKIVVGDPIPPGYRAVWSARELLAMAKLHDKLDLKTQKEHYPGILLSQNPDPDSTDFIEVHIYGGIHRQAIHKVSGAKPRTREDQVILRSVKRKLDEIGATLETS